MMEKVIFLIPARKNSKGFKFKNRKLIDFTINSIPMEYRNQVYISTDDDVIKERVRESNINVIDRPDELAQDKTTMTDVLKHFIKVKDISADLDIVLLYLTYPERTWEDIIKIYEFFRNSTSDSLVCADEIKQHPYLCFYEKNDLRAELIIKHDFYRRQDYPKCLKLSMFVACYKAGVVEKLHPLCMEDDTIFYKLEQNKVDVDNKIDLDSVYEGV